MEKLKNVGKIKKIIEKFEDVEFKAEGLGALEFTAEIFTKKFELEKIPFRIERVALQVAEKVLKGVEKGEAKDIEKVLGTFVAYPKEATELSLFDMDYDVLGSIVELIGEFQSTPFLFTDRARAAAEEVTK